MVQVVWGKHEVTWGLFQIDIAFEKGLAVRDRNVKIAVNHAEYCTETTFDGLFQLCGKLTMYVQSTSSFVRHRSRSLEDAALQTITAPHSMPHLHSTSLTLSNVQYQLTDSTTSSA